MNLKALIRRHLVRNTIRHGQPRGRGLRGYRSKEMPPELLTTTEIAERMSELGYDTSRQTVSKHAQRDELPGTPRDGTVRAYAAVLNEHPGVVGVAGMVSSGLAEPWMAELIDQTQRLVAQGVPPEVVITMVRTLARDDSESNVLAFPLRELPEEGMDDMRRNAVLHLAKLAGEAGKPTIPQARTAPARVD